MKDNKIATIARVMADAKRRDLVHHSIADQTLDGRTVEINGRTLSNFGTCSYLNLEHHEALRAGAHEAIDRYGTQFSSSRAFASLPLYTELEGRLAEIFERPVIVTPSTTLGHLAALPVIVAEKDAVIVDLQVHTSVQMAVQMLKADGVRVEVIRHNSMTALERKLVDLKGKYEKVWYLADGVYSIFGDSAPLAELEAMLERHPHFHLYIDDAHGMGWTGAQGRGWVRSHIDHHPRMVLAVSLNKSFAAAGGCLVLPTVEMAEQIRNCGGPMTFCGPIQPPMLGAALASVRLHQSDELAGHQARLAELIEFCNQTIAELGIPQYAVTDTPLFFIPLGLPSATLEMVQRLDADGFYTHAGSFPATPMKQSGLRFMLHAGHDEADIRRLLQRVRHHYPLILAEQHTTTAEVARYFQMPEFEVDPLHSVVMDSAPAPEAQAALRVELHHSIDELDRDEWDRLFLGHGNLSVSSLRSMELVFANDPAPEVHCDFYYCVVRDGAGDPVLATVFTHSLLKDDLFAPAAVSAQIEQLRVCDPQALTSKTISLGAPITRGRHLHLDTAHPAWREALRLLVGELEKALQAHGASQMMLRDFVGEEDLELSRELYDLGFTPTKVPEVSRIEAIDWVDRDAYINRLSSRYRNDLRREVLRREAEFEVVTDKPASAAEIREIYNLYMAVFERSLEMNVFALPYQFFIETCANPSYDVIRLYRSGQRDAGPVAMMLSYADSGQYNALIVGLDYDYVRSHDTYKQILFQSVMRARALDCAGLDLAFTASAVKKKVGAKQSPARVYMQILDHFNLSVIDSMARKAG